MDEQKLKARIGALRDQLEKLGARARVPSRSARKSARALDDVRGGLEQLRARCEELLDTGREGRRLSEAGAPGGGELAGALLEGLPHMAVVVDRDNTVLAANRIARRMGVKTGGLCWEEIPRSLCVSGREDAVSDPSDEPPSAERCSFCRCEEAIAKQYALHHPGIEAFGKSWDAYWIPLDEDTCLHYMADVTEVKRREEALLESESRSRSLYEAVQAGIILQAADGTILHANRIACEIFGMEEEDITARTFLDPGWEMIMEDGFPVPGEEHPSMITIRTGKPIRNAVRGLFAGEEAKTRWLLINTEPILDPVTEKLKEVLVTFSDITDRKGAERAIEDLAKFPSENPHPVMRVQADGTVLYMNAASESVLADRGWRVGGAVPEEWGKLTADVLESGSVESADLEHDGRIFSFRVVPVTDAGYVNWYGRDVTDFRRAAEQVERLAKFPSENPHPVMRVERDGALLYANAPCESLLREWGCGIGKQVPDEWREWVGGVLDSGSGRTVTVEHGDRILSFELVPVVEAGYVNLYGLDITERMRAEEELRQIEWLLTRSAPVRPRGEHEYEPAYGDLTHLNTHRLILDSVGKEMLEDIASDYLDLLQTSSAVYEKNGDYALGIFASGWCQFMDDVSRRLCGTPSNAEALKCGRWHCHESCWTEAAKVAIEEARPVDIECNGGIRLYTVPVKAGEEVIGAINFGYGDPPQDTEKLSEIAERYGVTVDELATRAAGHESRPRYMIEVAKTRLETSARLIGEIVDRKRAEEALRLSYRFLEIANRHSEMAPLLKEFMSEIKSFVGCAAVGIRILDDEGNIPYEAYEGFSQEFYKAENHLSINTHYCMCINVIRGETDPALSFYTEGGSFHMNGTTRFLATAPEAEKGQSRNACNEAGYESVALVPIRAGERILGLIHMADPKEDAIPLEAVAAIESAAMQLGVGIQRVRAEEEVRKARDELERRVQVRTADLAGALDGLQGEVRERIEVQKALAEANELLERMFSSIELMVAYMDRDFNFIRVNRAYAEADNHPPEFFVGKNHFDLYPSEENEAIFRRTLETAQPFFAYEKPFAYAQDPERDATYWDWSLQPVLEADGEVGGLILCLINVTERIRAREEAENQRRRLFAVLNLLPGYVFLMGPDYSVRFANHTFTDLFGDVGKEACHKVMHGIDRPCPLCPAARVLATQQPTTWEWTSDGGRCYRVYAYPFSDVDGSQLVLKLGIDITDRKVLENEVLEVSVKERRRIGQDLHDSLGQTLTGVAFLSKVLQEKLGKKSMPEASDAAEIAKQINASISLTRSLARGLSPVKLEVGGLMDALREYAADIQELYRISCVFQCDQSVLVPDNVVAIHVYHIAQEAVNNAIRHGEAKNISVRLDADDNTVNLTISDDGKGLPDGIDPTEGMGLRIMDYRARAIGGALEVTRGPERGTVVRCSFRNPSPTS